MSRLPLHAICPYFAMFPESFVQEQVNEHSRPGDLVFDPFCGRGTTVLESLLNGRQAAGSDINPVAVCVSRAKANRPSLDAVTTRLIALEQAYDVASVCKTTAAPIEDEREGLSPFFRRAFHHATLRELLFLRARLKWKTNEVDGFIAALTIGSLHGEMDKSSAYFSNQMPRTICLKPGYSLRYWRSHGLFPKRRRVFEMLTAKAILRLDDVPVDCPRGLVQNADARHSAATFPSLKGKVGLVVTSPPYLKVTRYEEDQWLRLWFLGGPPRPTYGEVSRDDRHAGNERYWRFLQESWQGVKPLLSKHARMVIRLGAMGMTSADMSAQLHETIQATWPRSHPLCAPRRSRIVGRQAANFLPSSKGCLFEMDYVYVV